MLNKLLALIRKYHMVNPGDRVICAVSGGADSMALLWSMYLLREKLGITLEAAHFNHGLRGEESDRDENFVREFCEGYEIPLHAGRGEVKPGKKGLEAAARDARYAYLRSLSGKIATAHTADDNAETVLMHLVRGTGLKGLGGITPCTDTLIRPMLTVTREELTDFLEQYHISYVNDSSNDTDAFLRNRLRHRVMPLLRQENPRLAQNLSSMAMELREDEAALRQQTVTADTLQVDELRQMTPAVRGRTLAVFLEHHGVKEPERSHVALAESLVFSDHPSAWGNFPGNVRICRSYGTLTANKVAEELQPIALTEGVTELPALGLRIICSPCEKIVREKNCFTVEPVGTIILRGRKEGDTVRLPGGTKSLKKLFIDSKLPAAERGRVPVLADDMGVLGVYGFGPNLNRLSGGIQIRFEQI